MGAVVPLDRPEGMLRQARSLIYLLFILFDTKHNLLFTLSLRSRELLYGLGGILSGIGYLLHIGIALL